MQKVVCREFLKTLLCSAIMTTVHIVIGLYRGSVLFTPIFWVYLLTFVISQVVFTLILQEKMSLSLGKLAVSITRCVNNSLLKIFRGCAILIT